nr:hypothetical protein [Tanacetum cinerariifolium]
MDIEEEEPEEDPVEEPRPLAGHEDQFDAHPNPQPGNMNGWVDDDDDDVEEEEGKENKDADIEEDDDAEIISLYEVQGDQTPPSRDESSDFDSELEAEEADDKPEAEDADDELEVEEAGVEPEAEGADAHMREIIRDQFATSINEFMANMNSGASGPGGAIGSGGAGGSGGTGGNADGTGVRDIGPTTKAMGIEAANNTPWSEVNKWMTEEFCPRSVIQRMEQELYNLRMKG